MYDKDAIEVELEGPGLVGYVLQEEVLSGKNE